MYFIFKVIKGFNDKMVEAAAKELKICKKQSRYYRFLIDTLVSHDVL